jgi:hypothetical protein
MVEELHLKDLFMDKLARVHNPNNTPSVSLGKQIAMRGGEEIGIGGFPSTS